MKETLSQYVSRIMRQKGFSQKDVAERSGNIAKGYVSEIASGNVTNLSIDKLHALARAVFDRVYPFTALDLTKIRLISKRKGLNPNAYRSRGLDVNVMELCAVSCGVEYSAKGFDPLAFLDLMQRVLANQDIVEIYQNLLRLTKKERQAVLKTTRKMVKDKKV